jgi:uncharacterized protein (TIGR02145 family)
MKTSFWFFSILAVLVLFQNCSKGSDSDGNKINIPNVTIGQQIWSLKNLDVTTYRNGDLIPQVTTVQELAATRNGAWCYYQNDPNNGTLYGKMYNWYAANDSRGLTPQGWHLPSQAEWNTLVTFLGGNTIAGAKLKSTSGWDAPNAGADNSSGFTALPGGTAYVFAGFAAKGSAAQFWGTYTGSDTLTGFVIGLLSSDQQVRQIITDRRDAQYVRCIKD